LGAAALRAQTPAAPPDQTVTLPNFNVSADQANQFRAVDSNSASRVRTAIADTPGSISVLTPEFLRTLDPTRLYEATQYVAGVSEGRGDGFSDRQIIRGFENTGRTVDNFASVQSENSDPLFIDRVEVIKGPSAILAPTGTPGGSINVVSKLPLYQPSNLVSLTLGLIDAQRVDLDLTGPFAPGSPFAYRVLGAYQEGRLAVAGTRDRRKIIGGGLSYQLSPRTTLTLRGDYEDRWLYVAFPVYVSSASVNGANAQLGPGFAYRNSRNGAEPWDHRGGQYMNSDLLLTSSFGDHFSTRVATKAQFNVQKDQTMSGVVPSLNTRYNPYTGIETPDYTWARNAATGTYLSTYSPFYDPTNIARNPVRTRGWTEDYAGQFDLAAKYQFGPVSSTTVAGVAYEHQNVSTNTAGGPTLPFNLYNPVYGANAVFTTRTALTSGNAQTWQEYANQRFGLWSDRILLTAGIVRVDANNASTNFLPTTAYTTLKGGRNLGLFGVVVKPVAHVSLYASRSVNAVPTIANNLPLWQQGQQDEFGAKFSWFDERLAFTVAHYQIAQTNVTVPNPAYQTDPTQPQSLISDLKDHGYEFEVTGGITEGLSVVASASFLRERDSLGRPVRAIAGQNAAALLNYRFVSGPARGLAAFVGTTFLGKRSGEAPAVNFTPLGVPTQPSFFLAPVELLTLGARYTWRRIGFAVNVDNALDKKYIEIPTSRANAGLGDPLNARLTTTYRF
jgi:iron complex outermembrane receptor protein